MVANNNTNTRWSAGSVNRRVVVGGALASGVAAATHAVTAQGTPEATPQTVGELDFDRVMMVSANLCGGARLNGDISGPLIEKLNSDPALVAPFEELESIDEFTEEAMENVSEEANRLATNILQYWFLGRYDGELVENRAEIFFDLACWQTLPYSTAPSTCKSFGYWAEDIEL